MGGEEAGVVDFLFVFGVVAAVDGSAGEVDYGGGVVERGGPGAEGAAIPLEGADVSLIGGGCAGEDDYFVVLVDEVLGEVAA